MTETKNLKVPFQTHEALKRRAKALGVKQFVMADALLLVGLQMTDRQIQNAVVNAQLTQPTGNTSPAQQEE